MSTRRLLALVLAAIVCLPLTGPAGAQDLPLPPGDDEEADNPWLTRRVLTIGHRGAAFEAPENTLFSLQTAVDAGANMVEFDIFGSVDGEPVVMHDATVDRTTDGEGRVDEMSVDELKELDAAFWYADDGTYTNHDADDFPYRGVATGEEPSPEGAEPNDFRIPTLEEVFARFGDTRMIVEIKGLDETSSDVEDRICELMETYDRGDDTLIAGFDDSANQRVANCAPEEVSTSPGTAEAATFFSSSRTEQALIAERHDVIFLPDDFEGVEPVDQDSVNAAHRNDLAFQVFTINDPDAQRELIDLGVDGIVTDEVTRTVGVFADRGVTFAPAPPCPEGARKADYGDWADIPAAHVRSVDCATARGVVRGSGEGDYQPATAVARDQMATFLAGALDAAEGATSLPDADASDDDFDDIDGNTHADAIRRLFAAEIVTGRSATAYAPRDDIRRDQVAAFTLRAFAYATDTPVSELESDEQAFTDVGPDSVHFEQVNGAAALGLVRGTGEGRFGPATATRRDQMASLIVNLLAAVEE